MLTQLPKPGKATQLGTLEVVMPPERPDRPAITLDQVMDVAYEGRIFEIREEDLPGRTHAVQIIHIEAGRAAAVHLASGKRWTSSLAVAKSFVILRELRAEIVLYDVDE